MLAVPLRQGGQLALSLLLGIFLLGGTLFLLMRPATAFAVDCTVTPESGPYNSIKVAIDDVNCDTIIIPDGTHTENLNITRDLTLQGNGQSTTIIDGAIGSRVITVTGAVTVYLYDLRVTNGDATTASGGLGFGGGIYVNGATLRGQNLQIDNNVANRAASTGFGGGLAVQNGGAVYLTNTLVMSNVAKASSGPGLGQGGAIYARDATVRMTKSQLYNNHAANNGDGEGGGVYTREANGGSFTIFNSIFGGNTALGSGDGAAIYVGDQQDAMTISFVTIADDAANSKTAIYFSGDSTGFIIIDNTIIASHAKDIGRAMGSTAPVIADYLLLFDNVTTATPGSEYNGGSNNVSGDPLFTNVVGNDYHIQSGSAAIDSGDVSLVITDDIDGDARPQGSGFDIGADEAAANLNITKSGPSMAELGTPIDYTLTVQNSGPLTATNLVITDTVPSGAAYVPGSGGMLTGSIVSFTATNLAPGGSLTATFSVTASQSSITNDDYRVTADGNISATGTISVTTTAGATIYLPVVLKN